MSEFFNVLPPDQARSLFLSHFDPLEESEFIETTTSLGRITARSVTAAHPLPEFRRSTMDGYAVRAADTFGAGEGLPAFLRVIGEVYMGGKADINLGTGEAVLVHTGGMIPATVDAVVQIEHTQTVGQPEKDEFPFEIEVFRAVAAGQNVLQIGEDVGEGDEILPKGHWLRSQDLGGLLAVGLTRVEVVRKPRVAILATGDEIVSPERTTLPGQIRDINSYTVAGQVTTAGGVSVLYGIVPDVFSALHSTATAALADSDMLIMSAGSSVSVRDMTVEVISRLGKPGVLFHGVATRPGKPTIVGVADRKPVIGLPGNPVSAMVQFDMFGVPALYHLQGLSGKVLNRRMWAKLGQNIASESGREDYIPARVEETVEGIMAWPLFGKSNLIFTLVGADGLIKIPLNSGGLLAGSMVEVRLF
jgi:molybdopterin molybdotransferase